MLTTRKNWQSTSSQTNFKSGLYLSIGVFNVILSMLPDKIQKVMQEVGCYGDRELGATYLRQAVDVDGVQQQISRLVVIAMDFLIDKKPFLHDLTDTCLQQLQASHPKVIGDYLN